MSRQLSVQPVASPDHVPSIDPGVAVSPCPTAQLAHVWDLPKPLRLSVAPVVPGLFLGEERAFSQPDVRRALAQHHGLAVVVRCIPKRHDAVAHQKAWATCEAEGLRLVCVDVEDDEDTDIRGGFPAAFAAIDSVMAPRVRALTRGADAGAAAPGTAPPPASPSATEAAAPPVAPEPWDLADAGPAVLVHCQAGVSRSASVVIGWLMHRRGLCLDAAEAVTRGARHRACPNDGFIAQLREDDERLRRAGSVDPSVTPEAFLATWVCRTRASDALPASQYPSGADSVTGLATSPFDVDLFCKYQMRFPFVANVEMRGLWAELHRNAPRSPAAPSAPLWSSASTKHPELAKRLEVLNTPRGRAFNARQEDLESMGEIARVALLR